MENICILGINCVYHESSVCVLKNGKLVAFIEEERLSRIKHAKTPEVYNGSDLPLNSILYCIKEAGITFDDIDYIAYNFDPNDRIEMQVGIDGNQNIPAEGFGTEFGERKFYQNNVNVIKKLSDLFGRNVEKQFHIVKHHVAHAASTFYPSGFSSAAILVIDGIAESNSTWVGIGVNSAIEKYYEINYPNSVGLVWVKMSEFLGFGQDDAEKVMGLASYGNYKNEIDSFHELMDPSEQKTFKVDNDILLFRTGDFSELEKLFGVARRKADEPLTDKHKDIAAALQHITEEIVMNLAREVKKLSGETKLCMAGGVALNVVCNAKVIHSKIFDQVYITPVTNDAGGAIGAALYVYARILNLGKPEPIKTAYLGPSFSNDEILKILNEKRGLKFEFVEDIGKTTAKLISGGALVAWFQGKMEAGPRALGHRSLLADPRQKDVIELINLKVKRREYFRPLAPSVLEEEISKWFDIGIPLPNPVQYMLMALQVKMDKQDFIPAVVHVDGTSRVQAVSRKASPEYWNLINEFRLLTGIPMLLNTSLNIQEPIVCSPADAIKTFLHSKIDYLVLGNYLCKRKESICIDPISGGSHIY